MTDVKNEIEKIKYHLSLVGSTLSREEHPLESLIIELDWTETDINDAHDIFAKCEELIESNSPNPTSSLERELKERFNIGYQTVKTIVLAFYTNSQWVDVCVEYAKSHDCIEFHKITKNH